MVNWSYGKGFMWILRFIANSIWYFRKQHLAVFAGTVIATAALTGALILGDSVKHSLIRLVDLRLGKAQYVITTGSRFVRAQLANDIGSAIQAPVTPLLLLRGIAINRGTGERLNVTQVVGIDSGFSVFALAKLPFIGTGEAVISQNTSQRLNLRKGDQFLLRVEKMGLIPVNAIFSRETGSSVALRLTVAGIANDNNLGRFSLSNNQSAPYNIFVSRDFLADEMQLDSLANTIILSGARPGDLNVDRVRATLKKCWQLQDASLRIVVLGNSGKYDLVSSRVFLDESIAKIISGLRIPHVKILTYLVNSIHCRQKQTPYSFITAATAPVVLQSLGGNEIIINRWLGDDLEVRIGDTLLLEYFVISPLRSLTDKSNKFVIREIIPTDGSILSKSLMPSIPGLSDAGSCRDWNSGVPIDLKRIRDKDEKYWNEYKGSPKAYLSYKAGQALWNNRFGNYTAIRFDEKNISADSLKNILLEKMNPQDIGVEVLPAWQRGKDAAVNSTDFGSLFLYLSFFIIAGSILLFILIYALNNETRKQESAVLAGLGYTRIRIISLRLLESAPILLTGGFAGALAGIAYTYALFAGLNTIWQNAVHTDMLTVHIRPVTLTISTITGISLSLISICWITWHNLKNPVSGLLKYYAGAAVAPSFIRDRLTAKIGIACTVLSLLLVIYSVISSAFQHAGLFLTAGGLFLAGNVLFLNYLMGNSKQNKKPGMNILRLALTNAGRSKGRSMAVIIILALGVFAVMLTGAYRRTFYGTENLVKSGTGGYQLWVETTIPVAFNLNSLDGRNKLILENDKDLDSVNFLQLHTLEGDDASCLNLNQVQKPRILGMPIEEFNDRKAFSFVKLTEGINRDRPWKALEKDYGSNIYPAFADQTVIQYGLKKSLGDTLTYLNEKGKSFRLVLAGGLDNSIFQGNLLVADSVLLSQFPSTGGSRVMLVDAPSSKQELVATVLRNSLPDYGIEITKASSRLAEFNSVENTYLAVFMMLGGLGLLIGTFGLGLVLLRNMLERKHELAMLMAVGYQKKTLIKLILTEYLFLLLAGIICGTVSAFIGIIPSIFSPVFTLQPGFLAFIIILIILNGFFWIFVSARYVLNQDLIIALKKE